MDTDTARQPLAAVRRRVRDELRERILNGRLKPGDRLVERDLAEDLGVSRVPVREAIRSLEADGFVVVQSPRRVVVRQLSKVDVEELFDVREALESMAAARAAERADKAGLRELKRLLEQAGRATAANKSARIAELNSRFHEEIITLAGNSLLSTVMQPLADRLHWLTSQNEHWSDLFAEHRELYEAIASGDPERARTCALEHVRTNRAVTLEQLFPED
ncbi:GntR family transcriptional regulator [Amycolatopsis sp. YIM 10]|uniref:GntR family transcriptional regulator n=1 Tax=Amycolatopsis sp. YIM 10 TaxID=2653857 RepID=UPI0012900405|nr:GntR family transcriptional regulator [Amycolatopsis sp. YIM 10]